MNKANEDYFMRELECDEDFRERVKAHLGYVDGCSIEEAEKRCMTAALHKSRGYYNTAAKLCGICSITFKAKADKYGINIGEIKSMYRR